MPHVNRHAKAFTLTELLLAVLVLLVVIAATARIFGTAQRVSSVGEANASILQDAGAIERRLRDDLARMSDKGYMAIRNVAVRNDINDDAGTNQLELLNPDLPANAILRLDQLVFFAEGTQDTVDFVGTVNLFGGSVPSSALSRIMYGHAVQVPDRVEQALSAPASFDPDYSMLDGKVLTPWVTDAVSDGPSLRLTATTASGGTKTVNGTQPGAIRRSMPSSRTRPNWMPTARPRSSRSRMGSSPPRRPCSRREPSCPGDLTSPRCSSTTLSACSGDSMARMACWILRSTRPGPWFPVWPTCRQARRVRWRSVLPASA